MQLAVLAGAFQRAHHGGAHRDDPATVVAGATDLSDQMGADIEPFAVHVVILQIIYPHRLERTGTHMQRDVTELDPAFAQAGQHGLIEMQPGGRRGDRAGLTREHGLVALQVAGVGVPVDVRRQRHFTELEQQFLQRLRGFEMQPEKTFVAPQHHRMAAIGQFDPAALFRCLADAELDGGLMRAGDPLDQDLHRAAGALAPVQPRRQHAGVVEHQQIAGPQEVGQLTEHAVLPRLRRHIQQQQPARRTLGQWHLRDQFGRQFKIEIGFLQGTQGQQVKRDIIPHWTGPWAMAYNQPFCRASRYASMRLVTPSLPIASDR